MSDLRHDKKVTLELDTPLTNIGRYEGGKYNGNNNTTTYHGRVEVSEEVAEDLLRRQKDFNQYEKNLIRNNGKRDMFSGEISGSQA